MTGADVGEAEQLGCGQALREGISPDKQLRQKCLLWGRGGRGGRSRARGRAGNGGWGMGLKTGARSPVPSLHRLQTTYPWGRYTFSLFHMTPEVAREGGN